MNNIKTITTIFIGASLFSCAPKEKGSDTSNIKKEGKEILLSNLYSTMKQGVMLGHHDDPLYGIVWEFEEGRSDIKSVCGDYPAVMSFDLGHIELGNTHSLDSVPFATIRKEIIKQYERGGLITLSWHARNPQTGGDAWDVSDTTVVSSILPGGKNYEKFQGWLNQVNQFVLSLKTESGSPIPILFRPWHEHTGSWFWWGENLCSPQQYKDLWKETTDYFQKNGAAEQILYAYSPGSEPQNTSDYLERYPGDEVIDVIGFDCYQREDKEFYLKEMERNLAILDTISKTHDKIPAITETGYEAIPDKVWWTETILPLIKNHPLSYVLVWRNAREKVNHYFAPYPGQISADDFKKYYEDSITLFGGDVNLYKVNSK